MLDLRLFPISFVGAVARVDRSTLGLLGSYTQDSHCGIYYTAANVCSTEYRHEYRAAYARTDRNRCTFLRRTSINQCVSVPLLCDCYAKNQRPPSEFSGVMQRRIASCLGTNVHVYSRTFVHQLGVFLRVYLDCTESAARFRSSLYMFRFYIRVFINTLYWPYIYAKCNRHLLVCTNELHDQLFCSHDISANSAETPVAAFTLRTALPDEKTKTTKLAFSTAQTVSIFFRFSFVPRIAVFRVFKSSLPSER